MAVSLNVVALVSGGKDSFFSILHCLKNGHKVIALANLYPTRPAPDAAVPDDIDSFMYQTIGHNVIPLYAEALGAPLFRQQIIGTAVNADRAYSDPRHTSHARRPDETESLVPLLQTVKAAHPELNAVCTGAILSDYQRTRVESVALRLGLVPLSYLWQYPWLPPYQQTSLLDDMRSVGQEARIIKVASGGLDSSHLWLDLVASASISRLSKSLGRFGPLETGAILGEGGEFETLALSGPRPVWKRRIVVQDGDWDVDATAGGGGSFAVKVARAATAELEASVDEQALDRLRVPDLLDDKFVRVIAGLAGMEAERAEATGQVTAEASQLTHQSVPTWQVYEHGDLIVISNMVSEQTGTRTEEQTSWILDQLQRQHLTPRGLSTVQITQTFILLRSMADFAHVNSAYQPHFTRPGPPSRITVANRSSMPDGWNVMISAWVSKAELSHRHALHVQSRSYWAPANIGPYSQAVSIPAESAARHVHVAGQIALVPASMELTPGDFATQAVLSLQHLWRIGQAMRVHWWSGGAIAFVASKTISMPRAAAVALRTWALAHELEQTADDAEDEDIAERSLRGSWASAGPPNLATPHRYLPDHERLGSALDERVVLPPCYVVEVDELPRGASIEWSSYGVEVAEGAKGIRQARFWPLNDEASIADGDLERASREGRPVDIFVSKHSDQVTALAARTAATVVPCKTIWGVDSKRFVALVRVR